MAFDSLRVFPSLVSKAGTYKQKKFESWFGARSDDVACRQRPSTHLAAGELLEELRRLVRLAELEVVGHFHLGTGVLGRDEGLVRAEVLGVSVQRLKLR